MASLEAVMRTAAPRANPKFIAASKNAPEIMRQFGITTPKGQAIMIAQTAHECGFARFEENLKYSAKRLTEVWPSRFPSLAAAQPFANNPSALANKVYNGRMGNRVGSNDGWNYRGSGPLQHTGASEFDRVERRTGLLVKLKPEMLRDVANADAMWKAACSYVVDRGALAMVNAGDVVGSTQKINGGQIGISDRKIVYARTLQAMAGATLVAGGVDKVIEVATKERTTAEQVEDEKARAKKAAGGATVAGGGAGGGAASETGGGFDIVTAVAIGVGVFILIGAIAVVFWRRSQAAKAKVETMQLEAIKLRADSGAFA